MISHMYLMWGAGNPNLCGDYDNTQNNDETWTCDVTTSYTETFAMFFSLESQSNASHSLVSFINGFIFSILILNILIAITSNYIMMALEKGNNTFWMNRLQFITECQSFFSLFTCWKGFRNGMHREIDHVDESTNYDEYSRVEMEDAMRNAPDIGPNSNSYNRSTVDGEEADRLDILSTRTDTKIKDNGVLIENRISFGRFNRRNYKTILSRVEKQIFFRWWFDQGKNIQLSPPSLKLRLKYFFTRASLNEIMFPAKEFENVVMGIQYNKRGEGYTLLWARLLSYVLAAVTIIIVIAMFALGTVTFGLCWHPKMKQNLFYVETVEMSLNVEKTDELKHELLDNLADQEIKQEKKMEKMLSKQSEKGKKQWTKVTKTQKEFAKKQNEHEGRFNDIDQHLDGIKSLLMEMAGKNNFK